MGKSYSAYPTSLERSPSSRVFWELFGLSVVLGVRVEAEACRCSGGAPMPRAQAPVRGRPVTMLYIDCILEC